jgi:hypothetical protein
MNTRGKDPTGKSPITSTEASRTETLQEWGDRFARRAVDAANAFLERKAQEDAQREPELRRRALEAYGGRNRVYPPVAHAKAIIHLTRNPVDPAEGPTKAQLEAMRNIAGYHVEAGTREFGAWTRRMLDNVGEVVIPYLQDLYEHATMGNDLSEVLENEHKAGKVRDELYNAMKLKSAK